MPNKIEEKIKCKSNLWDYMVLLGKYYIRDLSFVHTSRVKLDKRSEIQIQKGSKL